MYENNKLQIHPVRNNFGRFLTGQGRKGGEYKNCPGSFEQIDVVGYRRRSITSARKSAGGEHRKPKQEEVVK